MTQTTFDRPSEPVNSVGPTDPAGPTGQLATWLAETSLADVPTEVSNRARYLLLDGIGCLLVGAQLPWSEPQWRQ